MKRFFSLFLLVALTAACNNTSANDARRYVQGEYPEYKILLEPVATTSGEVFDGNRYILCSPANRIAAAQIHVSWGDVSGVRMTEIDPQTTPTLCGDAAKEPSKMAEKLAKDYPFARASRASLFFGLVECRNASGRISSTFTTRFLILFNQFTNEQIVTSLNLLEQKQSHDTKRIKYIQNLLFINASIEAFINSSKSRPACGPTASPELSPCRSRRRGERADNK